MLRLWLRCWFLVAGLTGLGLENLNPEPRALLSEVYRKHALQLLRKPQQKILPIDAWGTQIMEQFAFFRDLSLGWFSSCDLCCDPSQSANPATFPFPKQYVLSQRDSTGPSSELIAAWFSPNPRRYHGKCFWYDFEKWCVVWKCSVFSLDESIVLEKKY